MAICAGETSEEDDKILVVVRKVLPWSNLIMSIIVCVNFNREFGIPALLALVGICVNEVILCYFAIMKVSFRSTIGGMSVPRRLWLDIHAHNLAVAFLFFCFQMSSFLYFLMQVLIAGAAVVAQLTGKDEKHERIGMARAAIQTIFSVWLLILAIVRLDIIGFLAFLTYFVLAFLFGIACDPDHEALWKAADKATSREISELDEPLRENPRKARELVKKVGVFADAVYPRGVVDQIVN
jgi:hypothetical protein